MSAAKMVADSTQGDLIDASSTKKRKKMVEKKKVKKKKESTKKGKKRNQEDEFDDSDLDLEKEIHPIGYYVKDRKKLLEEMFHCVRGQSMNRALPDVLKELPLDDLKRRCMEQLEVMSKKRIRRILAGDDPASISSSGTEEETSEEEDTLEMEEGEVDLESIEGQLVDSTSLYSSMPDQEDSERELELAEGSMEQESQSPYSQEEYDAEPEYGEEFGQLEEDQDAPEDDGQSEELNSPHTPEEPEEGEVIDDDQNESGEADQHSTGQILCSETEENVDNNQTEKDQDNAGNGLDKKQEDICNTDTVKPAGTDKENECNMGSQLETAKLEQNDTEKVESGAKSEDNTTEENCHKNEENLIESGNSKTESLPTASNSDKTNDDIMNEVIGMPSTSNSDETDVNRCEEHSSASDTRIVKSIKKDVLIEDSKQDDEGDVQVEDTIEVDDDLVMDEEAANIEREHSDEDKDISDNSDEGEASDSDIEAEAVKSVSKPAVSDLKIVKQTKPTKQVITGNVKELKQTKVEQGSESGEKKQPRRVVRPPKQDIAPALTRNQMELLELEMRARAIKAMLKTAK